MCPKCLLRAGLRADSVSVADSGGFAASGAATSVLEMIAATMGHVPHVLLRDTASGDEFVPPVRPSSGDGTDRSIRYRIDGEIARGGMGAIFKGHDPDLGREVALKVLRDDHTNNRDMVRRFVEEAQIGGQLQHPGIVPIYELGAFADRRPFFTMKLVKGRTLAAILLERNKTGSTRTHGGQAWASNGDPSLAHQACKERASNEDLSLALQACEEPAAGHLEPTARVDKPEAPAKRPNNETLPATHAPGGSTADLPRLLSIFEAVCQTAAYAHARGVIHRDLKPANVMVGAFGEVQVMDWGLAKVLNRGGVEYDDEDQAGMPDRRETVIATARSGSANPALSQAGSVMGTPGYMAPEQARGEIERIDERADVFALGSILCEILTGDPAILGRSTGEIHRKTAQGDMAEALVRLEQCEAEVELVALAKDCLAAGPEERPHHASAVAERITAYLSGVQERLRTAEIARGAEAARAEEAVRTAAEANERTRAERRARRFQVGLAASLLVMTTVGGLSFTYVLQHRLERDSRRAQALAETTVLLGKARRGSGDPGLWREALAALQRVEVLGTDTRADALRDEIEGGLNSAERGVKLRQQLIEIRANKEEAGVISSDEAYAAAFRAAGMDLNVLEPAEFALGLRNQAEPVMIELAAFLDDWSAVRRDAGRTIAAWRKPIEAARLADPDAYRNRLRTILLAEDWRPASETLKALAVVPEAAELPAPTAVLLGRALAGLGETQTAVALLRSVVARSPGDLWVNYHLALTLDRLRPSAREDAARYYTAARAIRPETAHELAHLLDRMGRGDEAVAIFRDLTRRRPNSPRHLGCLGSILERSGRAAEVAPILDQAIAAAREEIRDNPDDDSPYSILGLILCDVKHDYSGAEDAFLQAIRLNPDDVALHCNLGIALFGQKKWEQAVAQWREAIHLNPNYAAPHYSIGNALRDVGKLDEAVAEYRAAIRLNPDDSAAHNNLGAILQDQRQFDAAIAEYRAVTRLKPDDSAGHSNLGNLLNRQGKHEEAVAEWREAIRLNPRDAQAHYNMGGALWVQNKPDASIEEYRAAIAIKPDYIEAHTNLGSALHFQGKLNDAAAAFREAIRLRPEFAPAHYNLGRTLNAQRKPDEAAAEWRLTIRLQPDFAEAYCNLASVLQQQGDLAVRWRCIERVTNWAHGDQTGGIPRRSGLPTPSTSWTRPNGFRPCFMASTGRKTTPSDWPSPRCATRRSGLPPRPASGTKRFRPIPSSAMTSRRSIATAPRAPPLWRPQGRARMSPCPTTGRRQSFVARPLPGSTPIEPP